MESVLREGYGQRTGSGDYSPYMKRLSMIGHDDVILKRFSSTPYPYATPCLHIY